MPKFRGDSNDWLDDEDRNSARAKKAKGAPKDRAKALPPDQANGTVAEVYPKLCRVQLDRPEDGDPVAPPESLLCSYRRAEVIAPQALHPLPAGTAEMREKSPVAVGDRIRAEKLGTGDGIVTAVCARTSQLARAAPDQQETRLHVLAANIEYLVIVCASQQPEFTPGLVDRFLIAAQAGGVTPIIVLNKIDLIVEAAGAATFAEKPWLKYREIGYEVHELSAKHGISVDDLRTRLMSHSVAFCGQSGVGKTSLLRTLMRSQEIGRIGDVSSSTGKGKHTTTGAVLLRAEKDSRWIDTPGVREFGLPGVAPEDLKDYYAELARDLGCTASGCSHLEEAGCRARELYRYASYRRIHESLKQGEY